GLELGLRLADPRHLRLRVDHPRHGVEVHVPGLARDDLGHRDAFLRALVRQHRAAHAISDRPHALDAGPAVLVDIHAPALVELYAGAVREQALRRGAAPDRDQQLVDRDALLALGIGVADLDFALHDLGARDIRAEADVETLLLELARSGL